MEKLFSGAGEGGIGGPNKEVFVKIERREEIRERLKRLNLIIVIKKYWLIIRCIIRELETDRDAFDVFSGMWIEIGKSGARPFFEVV